MKFFDLFRKKKEVVREEGSGGALPDGTPVSARLAPFLPQLLAQALPMVRIVATPAADLLLTESKFSGHSYWPAAKPYPKDKDGTYMYLLAQLNFSDIPHLEGYPTKGLLQFYVAADDVYGLNFDAPTEQQNFRVVYFENTSEPALHDLSFLESKPENALPVERPMRLSFALQQDYFAYSDCRYPEELADDLLVYEKQAGAARSLGEEVEALFPEGGHKIGGYAYFTQSDPRDEASPDYLDYILLLQIDSQDNAIIWGDVGVGNFFIHPDDLKRKDFSKVLYNWDCT